MERFTNAVRIWWRGSLLRVARARIALPNVPEDAPLLRTILFDRPTRAPLLRNQHVRNVSRTALVETAGEPFAGDPHRQLYLITAAGAHWAQWLRTPRIDLTALQRAVDKVLRRHGLNGILAFEFDAVFADPDESDHPLLWHVTALSVARMVSLLD